MSEIIHSVTNLQVSFSKSMRGTEHLNFHGQDPELGPALVSLKDVKTEDGHFMTHIILRLSVGTFQQYLPAEEELDPESILEHAKNLCATPSSLEC